MLLLLLMMLLLMCLTALTIDRNYKVNPAIYRFITSVIDTLSILSAQSIAIFDESSIYYVFNKESNFLIKRHPSSLTCFPYSSSLVCLFIFQTLFVAHGPSFKKGEVVEHFQNTEIYNMMAGNLFVYRLYDER